MLVLKEELLHNLSNGDDRHCQNGCHGDDPPNGIGPTWVDVVALG